MHDLLLLAFLAFLRPLHFHPLVVHGDGDVLCRLVEKVLPALVEGVATACRQGHLRR